MWKLRKIKSFAQGCIATEGQSWDLVCWAQSSVLRDEAGGSPFVKRIFCHVQECRSYLGMDGSVFQENHCGGDADSFGESSTHTISRSAIYLGLKHSQHTHTHTWLQRWEPLRIQCFFLPSLFPIENPYKQPSSLFIADHGRRRLEGRGPCSLLEDLEQITSQFPLLQMKLLGFPCWNALSIFKIVWLLRAVGPINVYHSGHTSWFLES